MINIRADSAFDKNLYERRSGQTPDLRTDHTDSGEDCACLVYLFLIIIYI